MHNDRPIFRGVVIGIIDEVAHHLADTFRITKDTRQFFRRIER